MHIDIIVAAVEYFIFKLKRNQVKYLNGPAAVMWRISIKVTGKLGRRLNKETESEYLPISKDTLYGV